RRGLERLAAVDDVRVLGIGAAGLVAARLHGRELAVRHRACDREDTEADKAEATDDVPGDSHAPASRRLSLCGRLKQREGDRLRVSGADGDLAARRAAVG